MLINAAMSNCRQTELPMYQHGTHSHGSASRVLMSLDLAVEPSVYGAPHGAT
jgi:hypothetical protein